MEAHVKLTRPSCFITNLPIPIITDILYRLPIKTLATCKSVCKSWLHLFRDPHFSQLYQARAPTEVFFRFCFDAYTPKLFMVNFDSLCVKLNAQFEFPELCVCSDKSINYLATGPSCCFANSCNGLLCYYDNRFAVVCNPCTSEFITFPAPKLDPGLFVCCGYGLGFSGEANKYKLLRLIARKDNKWSSVAEICTIEKACSWKTVGPCPSPVSRTFSHPSVSDMLYGTFFQGTLHWAGYSRGKASSIAIVTFDFETDQVGEVPLPPYYGETILNGNYAELGVLAGCLFITDYENEGVRIWLMKEYGVQASWINLFCFSFTIDKRINFKYCVPITYMDNGEILMTATPYVFFYNPVLESIRVISSGSGHLGVIAYRPSLALLKDSMLGYDVHVNPSSSNLRHREMFTTHWWRPVESPQQNGLKAPLTNVVLPVAVLVEQREGRVSVTSEFSASESSAPALAHQKGTEAQETSAAGLARRQGSKIPLTN